MSFYFNFKRNNHCVFINVGMLNLWKTQNFFYRPLRARLIITSKSFSKEDNSTSESINSNGENKSGRKEEANTLENESLLKETPAERLNRLLSSMQTTDNQLSQASKPLTLLPGQLNKQKRNHKKEEAKSKDIINAAAKVASLFNEDNKQQVESELLSKLLHRNNNYEEKTNNSQNVKQKEPKENDISITELIVGMKIDRSKKPSEMPSRSEYVKRTIIARSRQQRMQEETAPTDESRKLSKPFQRKPEAFSGRVNLFEAPALNIFNEPQKLKVVPDLLKTWSNLQENYLKIQISRPPANYFEKMALWTEQGKVWHFPINNEQDWSAEHNVDFSEHIFLDQHLESWCPQRGPVRHFMELVCVGLSKNPYLTAKEKKEHILWYRDYLESKKDILKEVMDKESVTQIN